MGTFSSSEHRGGQFTLLGLDVAQREPARVSVGYHRHYVVRPRQVAGGVCGLQNRQPESRGRNFISSSLERKTCDLTEEHLVEVNKLSECNVPLQDESVLFLCASAHLSSGGLCLGLQH